MTTQVVKTHVQKAQRMTRLQSICARASAFTVSAFAFGSANAAEGVTMPAVNVADILTYIGLLVAAVSTVGAAVLMIYLAAKGIKAIRSAF